MYAFLILFFVACSSRNESAQELPLNSADQQAEIRTTISDASYGVHINKEGAVPANTVVALLANRDSVGVKVRGEITEVCQKKGCWMMMNIGDNKKMRVTFKNYGFFVPKDVDKRVAVIEGVVKREMTDVATLQHYAQDAGKDAKEIEAISEPEINLVFVAEGVVIE